MDVSPVLFTLYLRKLTTCELNAAEQELFEEVHGWEHCEPLCPGLRGDNWDIVWAYRNEMVEERGERNRKRMFLSENPGWQLSAEEAYASDWNVIEWFESRR